jgi:hypothetical protein
MSPILTGMALGAAGAFLFDPQQGRRRRALLRDKVAHGMREGREFGDAAAKDLRARAQGAVAQVRALRGGPATDDVLIGRVRAKLGRYVAHRRAIHVAAQEGIVRLTGDVLAGEHPALIRALRSVPGVRDVDDRLDVHPSADGVSSLQGGLTPSGEPLELLQARWAPGTRAVVGGAGALLVLYALVRGGVLGVAALGGGAALLARARANKPLRDIVQRLPAKTIIAEPAYH